MANYITIFPSSETSSIPRHYNFTFFLSLRNSANINICIGCYFRELNQDLSLSSCRKKARAFRIQCLLVLLMCILYMSTLCYPNSALNLTFIFLEEVHRRYSWMVAYIFWVYKQVNWLFQTHSLW